MQLVGVGSPGGGAAGHVPQAINVPLEQREARFEDLKEGRAAVLCQSGKGAGLACERLRQHHDGLFLVE
ncbi:MAG: rhodanese-like domain-containing protein [Fimbriimonadaceae bacterium]|nr:rhodanese-like domain-containing protein [Fimbriimonadaceae bacterium]QYK58329.1 MAG: rhodanese-like domain-containing protein [Fimbriimonadaceae bacterium]